MIRVNEKGTMNSRGGGLVYFADGMCTPFRVSFSPLFSRAGYRKKAIILKTVVKRGILLELVVISNLHSVFVYVLEYTFRRFFLRPGIIWRGKF